MPLLKGVDARAATRLIDVDLGHLRIGQLGFDDRQHLVDDVLGRPVAWVNRQSRSRIAQLGCEAGAGARGLCGGVVVVDEVRGGPRAEEQQEQDRQQQRHLDHRLAASRVAQAHHCCGSRRKRLTVVLLKVVVPISSVYEKWMTSFA